MMPTESLPIPLFAPSALVIPGPFPSPIAKQYSKRSAPLLLSTAPYKNTPILTANTTSTRTSLWDSRSPNTIFRSLSPASFHTTSLITVGMHALHIHAALTDFTWRMTLGNLHTVRLRSRQVVGGTPSVTSIVPGPP